MKTLLIGIALILVVGIAGFLYRNATEKSGEPQPVACTMEAKICPDGSSVGRTGPSCAFAPCPAGNVEDTDTGISYVLPPGYVADENAYGADPSLIGAFVKNATTTSIQSIIIRTYPIEEGKTANDAIIAHTMFESSGINATSMSQFKTVIINGKSFQSVTVERFEGIVHTLYYLPRTHDVLRFEVLEKDVMNWTDAGLDINTLPEHAALLSMLATLQVSKP